MRIHHCASTFTIISIFILCVASQQDNIQYTDDAVIVEVPDGHSKTITKRNIPVNTLLHPLLLRPYDLNLGNPATSILQTTSSCLTTKGAIGKCTTFRECYPYFKLPRVGNLETWTLGTYDSCTYFTEQGRQMFGVCCGNVVDTKPTVERTTRGTVTNENSTDSNESVMMPNANKLIPVYVGVHQISNWPPPIPTHPPDHTIPPLPTHPPSPGYPIATHPTPAQPGPQPWPPHQTTSSAPPVTSAPDIAPAPSASCGAKNGYQDQERIVGGHNADLGEWPWIAALFNGGRQFCGGSLIDNIHILSAAHCVAHMSSWDVARLTVRLGDYNIKSNSEVRHIEKKVKRIVRHRGFDSRTLYNDIAILTLDSPVQFNQQIRPICLPSGGGQYTGKTATVIGWGSLRESGPQPAVLQEVNIPIWSNQNCRAKYGSAAPGGIVEHMLCAGQANRDSCSGDSGGPLMVNTGKWTQVGIVSWGIGCGKGQYPGVYTRVTNFLPWINKNLK